jgi:hypothetical protein
MTYRISKYVWNSWKSPQPDKNISLFPYFKGYFNIWYALIIFGSYVQLYGVLGIYRKASSECIPYKNYVNIYIIL